MPDDDAIRAYARDIGLDPAVGVHHNVQDALSAGVVLPAGAAIVRALPFAFDTANLTTGHTLYVPTPGDVLLDAWISVTTAWNGTTPSGDIGFFTLAGPPTGLFVAASGVAPEDMTNVDVTTLGMLSDLGDNTDLALSSVGTAGLNIRVVPAKFVTNAPLQVVVSQTGIPGGADPGASQGAAVLYLVTATPV